MPHFVKADRGYVWSTVIRAVQIFNKSIDAIEIYRHVCLARQMIPGRQHICSQHFHCLPLLFFLMQRFLFICKKSLERDFFGRLRGGRLTVSFFQKIVDISL